LFDRVIQTYGDSTIDHHVLTSEETTMPMLRRRAVTAGLLAAPFVARAADPIRLRVSLDTAPSHMRNVSFADYLAKLEAASKGAIKGEIFSSGALFADRDVAKALLQGQAEMAAPGTWIVSAFIPDAELFQLPAFYGTTLETQHRVTDGKIGGLIGAQIQQKLRVRVLGPWLDLGFNNWYSTKKPLNSVADLAGLKIRNSGGVGQAWRARFFGGIPNTTAWPDVPLALSQGTFDAISSTDESCASSKLWEAGLRYGLRDHSFLGEYVPLVSDAFMGKLPAELQKLLIDTWAENIPAYRVNMDAAQTKAANTLAENKVVVVVPTADEIAATRKRMMPETDQLARDLKLTPEIVKMLAEQLA
jgi:C4-dicarboxylate-binding protein DctP